MKYDNRTPCASCPYRRDAPLGLWDRKEFVQLLALDRTHDNAVLTEDGKLAGKIYACHEGRKRPHAERRLCIGWVLDQRNRDLPNVTFRLILATKPGAGELLNECHARGIPLFRTLRAMCRANGVTPPKP